jgi:chorismate mutase / prephenate dehydratase
MEAAAPPPLEDLRAEIDRIDQAVLELLIERSAIVSQIGVLKADRANHRLAVRPAREAVILRRLAELADGRFPRAVLVRMWRELLAATTRLQTPLSVAVHAARQHGFRTWDLARDHFGSITPTVRVDSASQALRSVSDGSATVAVVPLPNDEDPWWLALISDHHDRVRVFARLPFVAGGGEGEDASALALGRLEPEPSGDDLTLLAIEAGTGVSRGRLRDLLQGAGLEPSWLAAWRCSDPPQAVHLVEIGSFVFQGDERVAEVLNAARGEVLRIVSVGGYPRPLPSDDTAAGRS